MVEEGSGWFVGERVGSAAGRAHVQEIFTIFELVAEVRVFTVFIDVLEGFEFTEQSRADGFHGTRQQFTRQVDDDLLRGIVTRFNGEDDFVGSR